jgi:hypothetical protein
MVFFAYTPMYEYSKISVNVYSNTQMFLVNFQYVRASVYEEKITQSL